MGVSVAAVVAVGMYLAAHGPVEIRISQSTVQAAIDGKLPLSGSRGPLAYRVEKADVEFRPDGRIGVDAVVHAEMFRKALDAELRASGVVVYRDAQFFVTDFAPEGATVLPTHPAPAQQAAPTHLVSGTAMGRTVRAFAAGRVDALGSSLASDATKAVQSALDVVPVYRIEATDMRRGIAKMLLTSVRSEDGVLVAVLDPLGAVLRFVSYAAMLLGCMVLALSLLAMMATGADRFVLGSER